jgi:hypothetical protein
MFSLPARARQYLIVLLAAWWSFSFQFVWANFQNDHFDHLSKARQVLLGEVPQRDFFDPGRPLTIYVSAAVQRVSPTLFSEFLLTIVATAIGVAIVYILARSITSSSLLGVIAAMLTISMKPRLYSYPKIILFPLSVWVLWRYIDRPDRRRLIAFAVMTVVTFLFRYDYGIDIAVMGVVTLIALHKREAVRPVLLYIIAGAIVTGPYLGWLAAQGLLWSTGSAGLLSMAESAPGITVVPIHLDLSHGLFRVTPPPPQMSIRWAAGTDVETRHRLEHEYGLEERSRKGDRTMQYFIAAGSPSRIQTLLRDSHVEETTGINRSTGELVNFSLWSRIRAAVPLLRLTPGIVPSGEDAAGWIYYVFLLSPPTALALLWFSRGGRSEALKVISLSILCLELHQFLIRGSLDSRLPDVTGPTAVLIVWIVRVTVDASRAVTGRWAWTVRTISGASMALFAFLMLASVTTYAGTSWADIVWAGWPRPGTYRTVTERLRRRPLDSWTDETSVGLRAATRYVAECLTPDDRLMLPMMYQPEVFYLAERSFAGGVNGFHGGEFAPQALQEQIVARMQAQSVPVVIVQDADLGGFRRNYEVLASYVESRYREAAVLGFGDANLHFHVFVDKRRNPVGTDSRWSLPCFQAGSVRPVVPKY